MKLVLSMVAGGALGGALGIAATLRWGHYEVEDAFTMVLGGTAVGATVGALLGSRS